MAARAKAKARKRFAYVYWIWLRGSASYVIDLVNIPSEDMVDMNKLYIQYNWRNELLINIFLMRSSISTIVAFQNACCVR